MFWLRFFTGPSRVKESKPASALNFTPSSVTPAAKLSFEAFLQIEEDSAESVEEHQPIRTRGGRRSAIDLPTDGHSLDIGPQVVRLSYDAFCKPSHQLLNLLKGYNNIQTFHRGSHSRILKAHTNSTNKGVSFKLYDKTAKSARQIEEISKEIEILKMSLNGTVKLVNIFEDDKLILLVQKDYVNGTLMAFMDDYGGCLPEKLCVKNVASPILKILSGLHKNGVVHRNLKPEHILFDDRNQPHLCDFYAAGFTDRDPFTDREGTLSYMAPEVLSKPTPEEIFHIVISAGVDEADLPCYNEKVDIWSLGIVVVEALTGNLPFVSDTADGMTQLLQKHSSGENCSAILQQLEASGQLSDEGVDFIRKALQQNPDDRPDAHTLLNHPWILSVDD